MATILDTAAPAERRRARRRTWWTVLIVALSLLLVVLAALWSERRPIAVHFIDSALRARGVPARYRIVSIGPREQRIADLVVGDPAAPDLTARSVTVILRYGFGAPALGGLRADGVRLRARLEDGKLRLGAIDRLLPPPPSNAPLSLPDLKVRLSDARMRLETPAGLIGLALAGDGNLADGFGGRLVAVAPRLAGGGCVATAMSADVAIRTDARRPALSGPVRAAGVSCPGARVAAPRANLAVRLDETLARWDGTADVGATAIAGGGAAIGATSARIAFAGSAARTAGQIDLAGAGLATGAVRAARLETGGDFVVGNATSFTGALRLAGAALPASAALRLQALARSAGATPVGPLANAFARAFTAAARDADARTRLRYANGVASITDATLDATSGARVDFSGGTLDYATATGAIRLAGTLETAGGGLPSLVIAVRPAPGGGVTGTATLAPYAAGEARLALTPVSFASRGGRTHLSTTAMLDGPLAGGRVEGLSAPIGLLFGTDGTFALDAGCLPVGFRSLAIAGSRFDAARLRLCPNAGPSLIARSPGGATTFGASIAATTLGGRIGTSPLSLGAGGITVGASGFAAKAVAVRIGPADRPTRLDLATLAGASTPTGLGGTFAGAAGQIGPVPLLFSDVSANWTLAGAVLALKGRLTLSDAQTASPRFEPLVADDVALALKDGTIRATGTLRQPKTRDEIATVRLVHDLGPGTGEALLGVRGIAFTPLLQPEMLSRLTLGLIADTRGTVSGSGMLRWTAGGVTSSGDFETGGIDLSAAFGPVKGIKGRIHFSDLLALETPPGQTATIAEANTGIAVTDGVVHYQLLAGQRVAVESGRWPFAGGALLLQPTIMDFSRDVDRHLTFQVQALDAAKFIEQLAMPNLAATGTFDGVMPMIFDSTGGRIEGGHLVVRPAGGTLAYVGEITKAQLGTFGKLAFDALRSIRYQHLAIDLDGRLDGEIVSRVNFNGVNQQPLTKATPFTHTLQRLPFTFNITLRAPFRGLLGSARDFIDPGALVRESIATKPAAATPPPVQPPESGARP